jgi:hypothetical protein
MKYSGTPIQGTITVRITRNINILCEKMQLFVVKSGSTHIYCIDCRVKKYSHTNYLISFREKHEVVAPLILNFESKWK